jgi:hypothetical protein
MAGSNEDRAIAATPSPRLSLDIRNTTFSGFLTMARGGSVMFVRNAGTIRMDAKTKYARCRDRNRCEQG